ncbi:MAG TPA: Na+/H+ antiporter NhaA [Candidatus Udaeobacter sp.]|nr:Na+/H+ antiporter NhaA [Candidatus Udaeobacter sp.]
MPTRFKKVPLTLFQRFFRTETLGGVVLLGFALAALAIANSPLRAAYNHLWEIPLTLGIAPYELRLSLHDWINDGLMAVFFLLVGLEIKRELLGGELSTPRQAALPIACAIGGMVVPALAYLIFNFRGVAAHGWGIPMATDIAFALGALNLIAPRAPIGAKVLLTALAIVDDIGAVIVISLFYSQAIVWSALGGAAVTLLVLIGFNLIGVRRLWPYLLVGVCLWCFVHASGVHATIAGVVLAFTIPARSGINALEFSAEARSLLNRFDRTETGDFLVLTNKGQQETVLALERASKSVTAPILRLEHALHNFSAFVVMPLFAFANAGVKIDLSLQHAEIGFGILSGLLFGKPLGIMIFALIAVKTGIAKLPQAVNWKMLLGYACLAGIGFTMSLFIAMLAFEDTAMVDAAKRGIIAGSLLAGIAGIVLLKTGRSLRDGN